MKLVLAHYQAKVAQLESQVNHLTQENVQLRQEKLIGNQISNASNSNAMVSSTKDGNTQVK